MASSLVNKEGRLPKRAGSVSNEKLISAKNLKTCVLLRWIYNERHPLEGEGPTSNPSSLVKKKKEDFRRELVTCRDARQFVNLALSGTVYLSWEARCPHDANQFSYF